MSSGRGRPPRGGDAEARRALQAGQRSWADAVRPRRLSHRLTEQWTDGRWSCSVTFTRLPSHMQAGWVARVLYPEGADPTAEVMVSQHVRQLSSHAAKLLLNLRRLQHTGELQAAAGGNRLLDPETEAAHGHVEGLARQVQSGLARLFSLSLTVTVRAPTLTALDATVEAVLEAARVLDATAWPADGELVEAAHTVMPLCRDRLGRHQTVDTTAAALSFPFVDDDVSMGFGQLWGVGARRPSPVLMDLRDREHGGPPAPHAVLVGPSGGGKTTLTVSVVLQQIADGAVDKVVLVDPKRDYTNVARKLGGVVVYCKASAEATINAFDLPPAKDVNGVVIDPVLEQVASLQGWLRLLLCGPGENLASEEYGLFEDCLFETYRRAGITAGNPETWDREAPVLGDLYDVLTEYADPVAVRLARLVYPYGGRRVVDGRAVEGGMTRLFSRPTTPGLLDNPFVVFDLEGLQERHRPAVVHMVGGHVWREARRALLRVLLGLDETRTMLDKEESAVLVGDLFTQGRSYGLQVISSSQSLLDYERNAQGLRALETVYVVALFKHEEGQGLRAAQARYGLSEERVAFLKTAPTPNAGEPARVLLVTHRGTKECVVRPSELELLWKDGRKTQ